MSNLKKVTIENYRGFCIQRTANFAVPNSKNGSGLTLIVGPNNSGKTSIIEALTITTSKKIKKGERHKNPPKIIIESDSEKSVFINIDDGSQIKLENGSIQHTIEYDIISSRRHWQSTSGNEYTPAQFTQTSLTKEVRGQNSSLEVAALFRSINKDPSKKAEMINLIKKVNKNFTSWTIDTDDSEQDYVKYITNGNQEHRTDLLGDGLISVMRICSHLLANQNNKVLIVDEPELSLHPEGQKALARIFSKMSSNRQIIICTHSPHFINFRDFLNGAEIIRLNKLDDKECVISQLDHDKNYDKKITGLLEDWHKPQLLDYVAKEILFYERVLFVEGQEDVALIKRYLDENNIEIKFEIFGYGVGGFGNMELFLSLAKDLKLERVVALFDKNVSTFSALKNTYQSPTVKFYELETDDIRDKTTPAKVGVFDNSGKLKQTTEANNFKNLFTQIASFLEN